MKILLLLIISLSFITNNALSNIVYVDNFDAVYPYPSATTSDDFDINGDGENDIRLQILYGTSSFTCGSTSGSGHRTAIFRGLTNTYGENKVNGPFNTDVGYDCTSDTLNAFDEWNTNSRLYWGWYPQGGLCQDIGVGNHKQGIRLIKDMPTGGSGYLFAYIDYSITPSGDVIVHGWFYEDTFNLPIVANTLLDYPYDANCIYYDTTVVTVYDTLYTTVTDTLIINVNEAGNPLLNLTTIKVYPNPTNDQITINNGDFALLNNYEIKIENDLGQIVFSSLINQQTFIIDLSSLGAVGLYYLILYDDTGNLITTRKLVLN